MNRVLRAKVPRTLSFGSANR